jgi:RNA polymerase sigma-70 factor (ECF subfamily)
VQEAFIKYLRHRQNRDIEIDNVSAWLYRVTHNLALDFIRKHKRVSELGDDHEQMLSSDEADPAQIADRREATGLAWQCLDILSDRERQMVILKVMEEKSYKEIADIMDLSVTNVGFILHTAMKKLAKALKQTLA